MSGGVKNLLVVASLAAASCAAAPNGVEIRPIADPGSKLRGGTDRLADAKGQLALGNVGLALEGFRKASREFPNDPEAFAGMAACYDAMGRYDLAQANYEAALAIAPRNPVLLTALAGSLERQGKLDSAAEVRAEVAQLNSASDALDRAQADPEPSPTAVVAAQTVTAALPAPRPVASAAPAPAAPEPVHLRKPSAAPVAGVSVASGAAPLAAPAPIAFATPDFAQAAPADVVSMRSPSTAPVARVSVMPPAARLLSAPAPLVLSAPNFAQLEALETPELRRPSMSFIAKVAVAPGVIRLAQPAPIAFAAPNLAQPATVKPRPGPAPRLQRMSLSEVALLTGDGPVWRAQVVAATPQKLAVRWVPVRTAAMRPNIRLLNAARVQGLAARNRTYLLDRGWRKIEIGDAVETRERSLVLYPATRPGLGRSLAAQFGFRAQPTASSDVFVVLLGRDAAAAGLASSRG